MQLTCPLSTVDFVEGKPQRPHRRLIALSGGTLVVRCSAVDRVVEQIPGWSGHWSNVSDVRRQLPLICLPSRAEQPVILVVRCYVISQGAPFLGCGCCLGRDDLTCDVAVRCYARPDHSLRCVIHRLESDCRSAPVSSRIAAIAWFFSPTAGCSPAYWMSATTLPLHDLRPLSSPRRRTSGSPHSLSARGGLQSDSRIPASSMPTGPPARSSSPQTGAAWLVTPLASQYSPRARAVAL